MGYVLDCLSPYLALEVKYLLVWAAEHFDFVDWEYTLIRVSWAASGSLLKFRLYDFNDYDDWARF